jgi:hypothetical protein
MHVGTLGSVSPTPAAFALHQRPRNFPRAKLLGKVNQLPIVPIADASTAP